MASIFAVTTSSPEPQDKEAAKRIITALRQKGFDVYQTKWGNRQETVREEWFAPRIGPSGKSTPTPLPRDLCTHPMRIHAKREGARYQAFMISDGTWTLSSPDEPLYIGKDIDALIQAIPNVAYSGEGVSAQ